MEEDTGAVLFAEDAPLIFLFNGTDLDNINNHVCATKVLAAFPLQIGVDLCLLQSLQTPSIFWIQQLLGIFPKLPDIFVGMLRCAEPH